MGLFDIFFPSEEKKLTDKITALQEEIEVLENRRKTALEDTLKTEAALDEIQEDYEDKKELVDEKLRMIESFDTAQEQLIRHKVIQEIYNQSSYLESECLREIRENFDKYTLEDLKNILTPSKYAYRGVFDSIDSVLMPDWTFVSLADDFLKMCVKDFVKQMKTCDWDSIRVQAVAVIKKIESSCSLRNIEIREEFGRNLLAMLEAKYLKVQKQIQEKEAEREERQAQKDFEAAIKRANKKQEEAQKMLERKQQQLASQNSAETISKFEKEIEALKHALKEAEEERQRAMSMAQLTKSGYVYVISNVGSFGEGIYKIGMTRRLDPMDRILELSNASVPFPFDVHAFIYSEDAPALEAHLHRVFDKQKVNLVNYRKEYFRVSIDEIKKEVRAQGFNVDFIDVPLAMQYKESLSVNT